MTGCSPQKHTNQAKKQKSTTRMILGFISPIQKSGSSGHRTSRTPIMNFNLSTHATPSIHKKLSLQNDDIYLKHHKTTYKTKKGS